MVYLERGERNWLNFKESRLPPSSRPKAGLRRTGKALAHPEMQNKDGLGLTGG